jgi:hypothetical protein
MEKILRELRQLSRLGWMELFLHPFVLPFYLVPAWGIALWNSKMLLWGRWGAYHGFHPHTAINSLFYRTQWINLNRYGRLAKSPILGLGNYELSNWWHLSGVASLTYANAGALTTLLGTIFMVLSTLVWLESAINWQWTLTIVAVLLFSSFAYLMAFVRQNYQVLSWMWLPAVFYFIYQSQFVAASLGILIISLLGLTALVTCIPLITVHAIVTSKFEVLLVLVPALLVAPIRFVPLLYSGNLKDSLAQIAKLIGLMSLNAKYKYESKKLSAFNLYFFGLYGTAILLIYLGSGSPPVLSITAYLIFALNQWKARFADEQSVIVLFTLITTVELINSEPSLWSMIGFMLVVNPATFILSISHNSLIKPERYHPFDIDPLLERLSEFLRVSSGSRILFAFSDPGDSYERIFDGYRVLLEAPLCVAAEKGIHLMPDWYAVGQTNHIGAQSFWGRSPMVVVANLGVWSAGYAIVYQNSKSEIDPIWLDNFDVISSFDWGNESEMFTKYFSSVYNIPIPKWFLLSRK